MTRSTRGIAVGLAAAASLIAATAAGGERGTAAGCTPGQTTFKGVPAIVFCGPAKATVTSGRHTWTFTQGKCVKAATWVSVSIGELVLGTVAGPPNYFGLNVGKYSGAPSNAKPASRDGTYTGGLVAIVAGGKRQDTPSTLKVKITLKSNRSKGTFSGPLQFHSGTMSGSFSC